MVGLSAFSYSKRWPEGRISMRRSEALGVATADQEPPYGVMEPSCDLPTEGASRCAAAGRSAWQRRINIRRGGAFGAATADRDPPSGAGVFGMDHTMTA